MKSVEEVIAALKKFEGKKATVYAHEGEDTGIVIIDECYNELGFIEARDDYYSPQVIATRETEMLKE